MIAPRALAARLCCIAALLAPGPAPANDPPQRPNVPRFVSLDSVPARLREGPSTDDPVRFIYERARLPVEVIAEHEHWRRIRDPLGTTGWMHRTLLSPERTVLVLGEGNAPLRARPEATAPVSAYAQPGVVAELVDCAGAFCEIRLRGVRAYIERVRVWGVRPGEGPP